MNKLISIFTIRRILGCRSIITKFTADGKEIPKKKVFENRITLIGPDNSVSITELKNAQSLSLRRDLKLVKIQDVDSKTRRPVYKLMTSAEYHEEELQRRKEKQTSQQNRTVKGQKLLTLSSRIGEHDLMTGVKKMMKLLEKQYEVKVIIAGEAEGNAPNSERIYTVIESHIKSVGKVLQKRNKGNTLKFQLLPTREINSQTTDSSQPDPSSGDKDPL